MKARLNAYVIKLVDFGEFVKAVKQRCIGSEVVNGPPSTHVEEATRIQVAQYMRRQGECSK